MNKQQLASKIWQSANKMRSKIEANEYKDYILGFIFYKFLSEKEETFLRSQGMTDEEMKLATEEDQETVAYLQRNIGYFISYDDLFSTWLAKGKDFDVSDVRDALSAFSRLISPTHKKVFEGIFRTLETGLSKLGENAASQTKAIRDLIHLIKDIPMDARQDYDVLGFIYEYLISNFAANAGKKAGEFYTPHEVSLLMSEIVADHLQGKPGIKIYDPTSGSGSLLINIGSAVAKRLGSGDSIKYYAQELKENTYNLTRMNLVMRGISPDNIVARNGDTLAEDWPWFDDNDPAGTYDPLYVDAVVSNPPYSQNWDPDPDSVDPRFDDFGWAPKSKADYAFLLHDLYHLRPDGIMCIVLPHGVLFRGGEEGEIRRNLVERNHIQAIIGLPANIFFGTGIPTIVMVLRQKREESDVLIVDASKGFEKVGKNNKLRASDIKRIVDAVTGRKTVDKFSRLVTKQEIRENGYNLNIPRYVDSSEPTETWDVYSSMFGGVPTAEVDALAEWWDAFPGLRESIFEDLGDGTSNLRTGDVAATISQHPAVKAFESRFNEAFTDVEVWLYEELVEDLGVVHIASEEKEIADEVFSRLEGMPLLDKYVAYQVIDDAWLPISADLEVLQMEGLAGARAVDPNIVSKKKDGKDVEVQEGWIGRVLPFEIVQASLLQDDYQCVRDLGERLVQIPAECSEIIESMSEEEKDSPAVNEDGDAFVLKEVQGKLSELLEDVMSPEIAKLQEYLSLSTAKQKTSYISANPEVSWRTMNARKNGTYTAASVKARIDILRKEFPFDGDSFERKLIDAERLLLEEKAVKKELKEKSAELEVLTKEKIEGLLDAEIFDLLSIKWIDPLANNLRSMPKDILTALISKVQGLSSKYEVTMAELDNDIHETETDLVEMLSKLTGSERDMAGLAEFSKLLGGGLDV